MYNVLKKRNCKKRGGAVSNRTFRRGIRTSTYNNYIGKNKL